MVTKKNKEQKKQKGEAMQDGRREKIYELWFRLVFKELIEKEVLTAALRPGNRIYPNKKGAIIGEVAKIRILKKPSDQTQNKKALFLSVKKTIRIKKLIVKKIGNLKQEDFAGMSPDCQSIEAALCHLGLIYNRVFRLQDKVTVLRWEYLKHV